MLRKAIVNVAEYYLRMAQNKTPAEMEAIIWQHDSIDGADHGQSCAAFASLTSSWPLRWSVSRAGFRAGAPIRGPCIPGRTCGSDPTRIHWASSRSSRTRRPSTAGTRSGTDRPLPGDWVLFDGHVEVITEDSRGTLRTVGGDPLPNFSVNAHEYRAPLSGAGVVGFVNNGSRPTVEG